MTNHHAIFEVDATTLLDALRCLGSGSPVGAGVLEEVLRDVGLADGTGLSDAGRALYRTAWVLRHIPAALRDLGFALRRTLVVQVIDQELRGFGAVPEDGVLDLLRLHRAAPLTLDIEGARRTFRWLNDTGVLAYSRKAKTVRSLAPEADVALPGEDRGLAAMISPKTPYSNIVRLRRILRQAHGVLWWADPHFGARALEDLAAEVEPGRVTAIRLLSGDATNVLTERSLRDFERFTTELSNKGVAAEWRVDVARDWHDRWLIDHDGAYNMPPVNNLYQGQYAEILPSSQKPPIQDWWDRSTPR